MCAGRKRGKLEVRFLCVHRKVLVCVCVHTEIVNSHSNRSSSVPSVLICRCIIDGLEKCENVQPLKSLHRFTQLWLPTGRTGTSHTIYLNI